MAAEAGREEVSNSVEWHRLFTSPPLKSDCRSQSSLRRSHISASAKKEDRRLGVGLFTAPLLDAETF